jgi:hypothetical protein
MSDFTEISIRVTVAANDSNLSVPYTPSTEDRLLCEMWAGCGSEYCQKHGCLNALLAHTKSGGAS